MREIELSKGLVALVDDGDYEQVTAAGSWHAAECDGHMYARRRFQIGAHRVTVSMHTFLTGWRRVDHIDGDGLNNTRANLRPATASENSRNMKKASNNTSGFKGVAFHRATATWHAYIHIEGRVKSLRYHKTREAAALAYDAAAREHFGDFARLNFPNEGEQAA